MRHSLHRLKLVGAAAVAVFLYAFSVLAAPVQAQIACDPSKGKAQQQPTKLRVALYPFTPDRIRIFHILETAFECAYPGVNVELIEEPNSTYRYYDLDVQKKRGFQFVDADVYEIDTILLSDFVALGKISPLPLPYEDFDAGAVQAVTRDGAIYAVPHWLCGNFLFYRRGDTAVRDAATWRDLNEVLTKRGQGLLVDLKGGLTLGEWYLTALAELVGLDAAQQAIVGGGPPNREAISTLSTILRSCPVGYCRSEALHDQRVGFYPRAFVRGQVHAFIGYSESIHYGLRELAENCMPGSGCLSESDIAVRRLPSGKAAGTSAGLGWVDAFAIDAKLKGEQRDLALAFIKIATDVATYRAMLAPEWPYRSRYLLPARPIGEMGDAPLYADFHVAHRGRETGTFRDLNPKLRQLAKEVIDCALPRDRDDMTECRRN